MNEKMKCLCVFCGSSAGKHPIYVEQAIALGKRLVEKNCALVYGAGDIGLMGTIADTVLEGGGTVKGVIPEKLAKAEVMHEGLTELYIVENMHERKAMMSQLADAFVALPGGYGTLEELLEVLTWSQLGIQSKPIGLLNVAGFYDSLLQMIDHGVAEGFIRPQFRGLFVSDIDVDALLGKLETFKAVPSILEDMGIEDS